MGGLLKPPLVSPCVRRTSQRIMASKSICRLCLGPGPLRHSHIIPEFIYLKIYDDKHRFRQISTNPARKIEPHQKGLREYLFCDSCEGIFSKWEGYAKRILDGGVELEYRDIPGGWIVSPIDYKKFKLFGMSLLWRASISSRPDFSGVKLTGHEEPLRKMLLSGNAGRFWEYGFSMAFPPERDAQEVFGKTLILPDCVEADGLTVCRFLLGTTAWLFFISDDMSKIDARAFALSEEGKLLLRSGGQPLTDYLVRVARDISARITE